MTGAVLLLASSAALSAQSDGLGDQPCAVGSIARVVVNNTSIFDEESPDLDDRFRWAYRVANALHFRTREDVVRRELLFEPGDCLDPFRVAETERLLRGFNFLSRAEVRSNRLADGAHEVVVDTRDDWSTRVDVKVRINDGFELEGLSLDEANLLGTGQNVGVFFFERDATLEYGLTYGTPQLAGTRWDLRLAAGRTRPGTFIREEISYPFVGEIGRWAGRQSFTHNDRFFEYIGKDDPALEAPFVLVPVRQKFFDAAAVRRFGVPGGMTLFGAGISYQRFEYPGAIEAAPDGDFDDLGPADSAQVAAVLHQTEEIESFRLSALVGRRSVRWVQRRGLESLRGLEDIKLGTEAGIALSRSIPWFDMDDDVAVTLAFYTGVAADGGMVFARGRADLRRDLKDSADAGWRDLYTDAELLAYWQPAGSSRHTLFFRAAALGAWATRTPFQLTLGGERAIRGYHDERFPGGRRALFTLEHRLYLNGPFDQLLDLGTTAFVDAGRIWPGNVPFGVDSGWRASAGLGLRGAFPTGSRTTYRLDFAWPIDRQTRLGDFRLRISVGEPHGLAAGSADFQFLRSRPENVGGNLFELRD